MQDPDITSAIFKKAATEQIGHLTMQVLEERAKFQTLQMQYQAALGKIDELQKEVSALKPGGGEESGIDEPGTE